MKSAWPLHALASPVIGSVDVLEHSSASGSTTSSISPNTWCLSAGSSKTASITRSQPARSAALSVGVIRREHRSRFSLRHPAASDLLVEELRAVGLALSAASSADVLEHDLACRPGHTT